MFLFLVAFLLLTVVYALLRYITQKLDISISSQITRELKDKVFQSLLSSDWSDYNQFKNSDLSNILISEVDYVGFGVTRLLMAVGNIVLLIAYAGVSFYVSVPMTILAIVCFFPFILIQKRFVKKSIVLGEQYYDVSESYFNTVLEFLGSFKLSKMFQWDNYFTEFYHKENSKVEDKSIELSLNTMRLGFVYEIGLVLIICFALFVSYELLELTFEKLVALLIIASRLIPNIKGLSSNYLSFVEVIPSYTKINELLRSCENNKEIIGVESDITFSKVITFDKVSFSYEESRIVFRELNLVIKTNEVLGITGVSGSGKTTFLDLLMGLNRPNSGGIYIDGVKLEDSDLLGWRKQIGYVPQEAFLFNTSIRKNIQMSLDLENLENFVEQFSWLNFISNLPQGLDTIIGDLGKFLSGGERQRICIARALYKKSTLLILDEATNSLDKRNEGIVLNMLKDLKNRVTVVLVSHDDSVLNVVDRVIKIN